MAAGREQKLLGAEQNSKSNCLQVGQQQNKTGPTQH